MTAILFQSVVSAQAAQTAQTTFDFHSGFWVNLHHTLYNQSAGKKAGRTPDLSALTPAEAAVWNEALDYYDRDLTNRDFLEPAMARINRSLSAAGVPRRSTALAHRPRQSSFSKGPHPSTAPTGGRIMIARTASGSIASRR